MSLDSIRALRLQRQKPSGVVSIVFSDKPLLVEDSPALVVIRCTDEPQFMDLRPLVGLWVALYSREASITQMLRAVDALQAVKCKFFGVVTEGFVLPMTADHTPRHAELLAQSWSRLCP
jgi:hypothetical protein